MTRRSMTAGTVAVLSRSATVEASAEARQQRARTRCVRRCGLLSAALGLGAWSHARAQDPDPDPPRVSLDESSPRSACRLSQKSHSGHFALVLTVLAASLSLPACKKNKPALEIVADASTAATRLAALDLPEDVMAVGGCASIAQLAERLGALAAAVLPPLEKTVRALPKQVERGLALKSAEALALGRPFRFAIFDTEKYDAALIFESNGKDKVVAAMPASKLSGDQGNAYSLVHGGNRYFNFVGNAVIFTGNPTVFDEHKAFLTALSRARVGGDVQIQVAVENIRARYRVQTQARTRRSIAGSKTVQSPAGNTARVAMTPTQPGVVRLLGALKRITARLDLANKHEAKLTFAVIPKDGSETSKAFTGLSGLPLRLLSKLPRNAASAVVAAFDVKRAGPQLDHLGRWAMSFASAVGAPKNALGKLGDLWKIMDGHVAMVVHDIAGGAALSGLYGVIDRKAACSVMDKITSSYQVPTYEAVSEGMGSTIAIKHGAYTVGSVPVTVVSSPMNRSSVMKILGRAHYAVGEQLVYTMGSKAKESMKRFLSNGVRSGLDQLPFVKRALRSVEGKPFVFGFVSAESTHKQIMAMMREMPLGVSPVPRSGITFAASIIGGSLAAAITFPVDELRAIGGYVAPLLSTM